MRRIFREYLSGTGLQRIADGLNSDAVPSPGAYQRGREPGETGWSKGTVRAILVNPRYAETVVPCEVFEQVRQMFAARRPRGGTGRVAQRQPYLLRGLVRCARCGRLMQGTRNNAEPYYRCRLPAEHAAAYRVDHPRNVYLRESKVTGPVTDWLREVCAPRHLLALASEASPGPPHALIMEAGDHYARALREARGAALARVFRALSLQLVYSDAEGRLKAKAVLAPGRIVVRATLALQG